MNSEILHIKLDQDTRELAHTDIEFDENTRS